MFCYCAFLGILNTFNIVHYFEGQYWQGDSLNDNQCLSRLVGYIGKRNTFVTQRQPTQQPKSVSTGRFTCREGWLHGHTRWWPTDIICSINTPWISMVILRYSSAWISWVVFLHATDKSLAQPGSKQDTSMSQSLWMMDPTCSREMPSCSNIDLAKIRQSFKISSWIWSAISWVVGLRTSQHRGVHVYVYVNGGCLKSRAEHRLRVLNKEQEKWFGPKRSNRRLEETSQWGTSWFVLLTKYRYSD